MAFFSKAGSLLRQTSSKHVNRDVAASRLSIFQVVRWMSSSRVFVGGLSYNTNDSGLHEAFSKYGDVAEARVIQDRETGRSRGFGFVTYSSAEEASAAVQALDGQELHGRRIRVNYANDRSRGFGGGGAGFGNSGGFGGYGAGGNTYGGGQDNFGSYSSGGGGGYAASGGGSYGSSGGNYGSYTTSGGGGYPNGGGSNNVGGNYASADNYDGTGAAGSFASNDYEKNVGLYGDGDQFGSNNSSGVAGTETIDDGNFMDDDDEPTDYASKSA